jgi:hypothetical protein
MGAGSRCMNDLTVIQTTQGLLRYLQQELSQAEQQQEPPPEESEPDDSSGSSVGARLLRQRGVCIGYDHRRRGSLHSEQFALLTAAVFLEQEVRVDLSISPCCLVNTCYRPCLACPSAAWHFEPMGKEESRACAVTGAALTTNCPHKSCQTKLQIIKSCLAYPDRCVCLVVCVGGRCL